MCLKVAGKFLGLVLLVLLIVGCGETAEETITVYSGRSRDLVQPVLEDIEADPDINLEVRYGGSSELATTIVEEGTASPADIFYSQDAGALGALEAKGLLQKLPSDLLERVDGRFRSPAGHWVGVTGRARVLNYNKDRVDEEELPESIRELTEPQWAGEVGWAPQNASFQAFVTAMRQIEGEEKTRKWLEDMQDNNVRPYSANTPIVEALGRGEIKIGLVNNYYLYRFREEDPDFPVEDHYPRGDAGSMINVSGAGIVAASEKQQLAREVINRLLAAENQRYFASETFEYPLRQGIEPPAGQKPLAEIETPQLDLSRIDDLQQTIELLRETGAL